MACLLAGGNAVGAVVDRGTIGGARPAALVSPSPLVFGAREVEAPAPVVGAFELGIDEAVDALVADDLMARFAGEAARHLFGRPARREPVEHLPTQGIIAVQPGAGPAPGFGLRLRIGGLVTDLGARVAPQLARDGRRLDRKSTRLNSSH